MNHDAPMTPAAMQAHIAELEQQLKLSDEGVSQLAQRCLELEQQLLACQTELAKHSAEAENITLTLPQLFYDTGSGFSPRECLTATEDVYNELTHEVSVTFVLPEDARAIRLDPGELACCITDLAISDERISFQSVNGLLLQEDSLLFLDVDPNLSLHCTTGFGAGMKFAVNYHYYPLGRFLHEQPGKSLLRALNDLKLESAAAAQEAEEVLQASRAECMRLNQQLLTLQGIQHEYQVSLETIRASSSWRAQPSSCWPAAVRVGWRPCRSNKARPRSISRLARVSLMVDWRLPSARAAAENEPSSAARTNASKPSGWTDISVAPMEANCFSPADPITMAAIPSP